MALASAAYAQRADALYDHWTCNNYSSAQTCYSGAGYHSWRGIINVIGTTKSEVCAKGHLSGGGAASGSGCNMNAVQRFSCLSGSQLTAAYGYWAGSGGVTYDDGQADTGNVC